MNSQEVHQATSIQTQQVGSINKLEPNIMMLPYDLQLLNHQPAHLSHSRTELTSSPSRQTSRRLVNICQAATNFLERLHTLASFHTTQKQISAVASRRHVFTD